MDSVEILHKLHTLNEDELFYKKYQEQKKDPRVFRGYLRTLNPNYLIQKNLLIPEIPETMPPSKLNADYYHDGIDMRVDKHNCYTPVFLHSHDFFEAFYVMEGTCEHEIEGHHQKLLTGDFCIIPPNVEHTISVQDSSIVITMSFTKKVIEDTFSNPRYHRKNMLSDFFLKNIYIKDANNYLIFHTGNDNNMRELVCQMIVESSSHFPEYEQILSSLFGLFFANLIRYYESSIEFPSFTGKAASVAYGIITYIQENHKTVTLSEVAKKFHYTPEHTSRFIKSITGKTYSDLLMEYRMQHAVSLLTDTSLPIIDISYEVGYENVETFNKVFKKKFSCTPTAYRRNESSNLPIGNH